MKVLRLSHDLRTPLTVLRGYLSLLQAGELTDAAAVGEAHATMRTKIDELGAAIEQLIEDTRQATAGGMSPDQPLLVDDRQGTRFTR